MKRLGRNLAISILLLIYTLMVGAPFFSPYSPREQFRDYPYAPPASLTFRDSGGGFHLWPLTRQLERVNSTLAYRPTGAVSPVRFFVQGAPYRLLGLIPSRTHLFGVEGTPQPLFILGSDELGRDLFSRILSGSQFSLPIGLASITFTLIFGVGAGLAAGYSGGLLDTVLMRMAEFLLALPSIFLILGVRAILPKEIGLTALFWLMVGVFTLFGWATVARVVRGQVRALRRSEHVMAARVIGASELRIMTRHILPLIAGTILVQAMLLIPAFTLGEITLSFLGVGVQEPNASWGSLLQAAGSIRNLVDYPWLLTPAAFVFAAVLGFNLLANQFSAPEPRRYFW